MRIILGLAFLGLASCGPDVPERAASDKVVEDAANPGAAWPILLQHCLRSPHCDPASDFGKGVGQTSGLSGSVAWFGEAGDVVKEGAQDYGAAITLSVHGVRGVGGAAGRPLTIDELPNSLAGANAKRSTLAIEYRAPGGGAPEAYGLQFRSAWLAPAGEIDEAMLEISGAAGVLLTGEAGAMAAEDAVDKAAAKGMTFHYLRNLRDEALPALMAALTAGETLSLKLIAPDGGVLLQDALYAHGYDGALLQGTNSLADPEIARTIEERCARFATEKDEFWKIADITPALLVCDPRPPEQRR
jgi:hypothetical protein